MSYENFARPVVDLVTAASITNGTAVALGTLALNPSGVAVTPIAAFTAGASYDATKWTTAALLPASGAATKNYAVALAAALGAH